MRARAIFGSLSGCAVAVSLTLAATSAPCLAAAALAVPEPPPQAPAGPTIDTLIEEAARRFAVPALWIRAVMRQESGFNPHATSHAGAMGLMQVMPATYAELRRRHGLGPDPYDPRDNVLAGAAYLRELYDRFGPEGMLPAYNAGPGRYLQHRDQGRPLPAETRDYIARIGARIGVQGVAPNARPALKAKYFGDVFPWGAMACSQTGLIYREFFQKDRAGQPKGVVLLDLRLLP